MTETVSLFERLGAYVLTWSWQMAVLVVCAWILVQFDRRHRPALRHRLWLVTLVLGLLLPWIPERIAAQSVTRQVRQILVLTPPSQTAVQDAGRVLSAPAEGKRLQASEVSSTPRFTPRGLSFSRTTLLQVAGLLWATGVLVGTFRRVRTYRRLGRVAASATVENSAMTPPILSSVDVQTPMLYGWRNPVILLPEDVANWSTVEERATMIRHESAHYVRKDHWVSAFQSLVRTVFFFHPLARWTCRQIDIERELACDEEVLRLGTNPETYAEAIIKVAERALASRVPIGLYFSGTGQLDRRVGFLFRTPAHVARSATALVPLFLLAPIAAFGFWQAPLEILTPIVFRAEVNPPRLLPEEVFAPAPQPHLVAAVATESMRAQDPPVSPAVPEPRVTPRLEVAFLKATEGSLRANIVLAFPHSHFVFKDEAIGPTPIRRASGRVEGRVTNLTGRIIQSMDEPIEIMVPASRFNPAAVSVFQKNLFLGPGLYRLFILVSDSNGASTGTIDRRLEVPRFPADSLSASSLILADMVEPSPLGQDLSEFQIGSLRVRPSMSDLRRDQDLNIFQQVYVPGPQLKSTQPLWMETLITLDGREIERVSEEIQRLPEVTIAKKIPMAGFSPGAYEIQTIYIDAASGERVASRGNFSVK